MAGGMVLCPLWAAEAPEANPVLEIAAGGSTQKVTKAELQAILAPVEWTVYSPVYQRQMTYEGFWLEDIFSARHVSAAGTDIVFKCADGYGTSLSASEVGEHKWLVAFGEPQGWTPLPERNVLTLPGPWYVIGREASSYQETPWPYRVVAIEISGTDF